ncbi:hypothetical protein H6G81_28025 [Scytonema hofmannii FACHB-248]|uniref:Uncharacterized protein n=1 Tax=Scytonema hofmannii FACHB-248 TaxID=1842502 RepID=A0ABR8GYL6_9CYAN|nr:MULTISPECIES: hypothetical protein [Nostocales]MBD2608258.1 hypothetical protein [Scytonema hofmannii FACHB-248]
MRIIILSFHAIALGDDRFKTGDRTCGDRFKTGDRTYGDKFKAGVRTLYIHTLVSCDRTWW